MLFVLASEKYVIDSARWGVGVKELGKVSVPVDSIEFGVGIFHVSSALDFENAGETWWHEMEIKSLLGLIHLFSAAELSFNVIEGLEFATSRAVNVGFVVDSWISVNAVRDFKIPSEYDLGQETWKLD